MKSRWTEVVVGGCPVLGQVSATGGGGYKGTLPKRATWTDNGPISGTGGFQKTGVEGATGNSKAEV